MNSSTQSGQDGVPSFDVPSFDVPSFDDDVRSFAQGHARILRELGYRSEAMHVERFVNCQTAVEAAPAA